MILLGKLMLIMISLLFGCKSLSLEKNKEPIKVAIVDTGFDFKSDWKNINIKDNEGNKLVKPILCKEGHKDFTKTTIYDLNGHGTTMAGIVAKIAGNSNYCLVILKVFGGASSYDSADPTINAINHAISIKVDLINYSGGGTSYIVKEYDIVKKALNKGIILVAAAGNNGQKIDFHILKINTKKNKRGTLIYTPIFISANLQTITKIKQLGHYPGSYDPRIIMVGNNMKKNKRFFNSNYGEAVKAYEIGVNVLSLLPNNSHGYITGTSPAAAIRTGKIIKNWKK